MKAVEFIKKNRELTIFAFIYLLFVVSFYFFTCNTGLYIDDYGYMYMFSQSDKLVNNRIDSLGEVFSSQYAHYFIMNGRSVSHFCLQFFLMLGKGWFNAANTVAYAALGLGMYSLVKKKGEIDPISLSAIYLVLMLYFADYGRCFLVCSMAVNYMWTISFIVNILAIFKRLYNEDDIFENKPLLGAVAMLLLGAIAGWSSENGSAALLFAVGCMGLYYLIKKKKIPAWCITGFSGMCIGFLMMILAPGYDIRKKKYGSSRGIIFGIKNISAFHIMPYFGLIIIALCCLFCILFFRNEQNRKARTRAVCASAAYAGLFSLLALAVPDNYDTEYRLLIIGGAVCACAYAFVKCKRSGKDISDLYPYILLMLAGFTATYSMVMSPMFQTRSEIHFLVLFSCGSFRIIKDFLLECAHEIKKFAESKKIEIKNAGTYVWGIACAACIVITCVSLYQSAEFVNIAYTQFVEREDSIERQKESGERNISVEIYDIPEESSYGFDSHVDDPEYWINKAQCWYYGVDSITYAERV